MERKGTNRGVDYCVFMGNHPLGQEKVATVENKKITARKSKKIYEIFRWKGKTKQMKCAVEKPCSIDEFVASTYTGHKGICENCRRLTKISRK